MLLEGDAVVAETALSASGRGRQSTFLGYMMDKTVSESDRDAMMAETSLDMFVSDQGIRMGDGQIWLSDPNFGTGAAPVLEVIAINGIVER